ncbi:hypothetical protein WJX81_005560 [Elliptochloris bilobata]|uniref:Coatomer subunit zeta n=1 Tax=Elliptochloris bilobata TaxID=381761 RepID=A0AAW1S9N1_9CHLO
MPAAAENVTPKYLYCSTRSSRIPPQLHAAPSAAAAAAHAKRHDAGRVQALIIATANGHVLLERFYERFSNLDRADIRVACQQALEKDLGTPEAESVSRFRGAAVVSRTEGDLVYYAVGTGEYDELTLAEALRGLAAALREAMRKAPSEAVLLDHYARLCLVVDEVVQEGVLDAADKDAILRGVKLRGGDV